jgi:hypothetical protein
MSYILRKPLFCSGGALPRNYWFYRNALLCFVICTVF